MRLLRVVAPVLLVLGLAVSAGAESSAWGIGEDSVGNGMELPHGLWVAGDATLHGQVPQQGPAIGEIDDLSLLVRWEPTTRLTLFGELRLEDLFEVVEGEGAQASHWQFVSERLYAEALLTPALSLRLGTVFTPFGLWNVVRRSPFTSFPGTRLASPSSIRRRGEGGASMPQRTDPLKTRCGGGTRRTMSVVGSWERGLQRGGSSGRHSGRWE